MNRIEQLCNYPTTLECTTYTGKIHESCTRSHHVVNFIAHVLEGNIKNKAVVDAELLLEVINFVRFTDSPEARKFYTEPLETKMARLAAKTDSAKPKDAAAPVQQTEVIKSTKYRQEARMRRLAGEAQVESIVPEIMGEGENDEADR